MEIDEESFFLKGMHIYERAEDGQHKPLCVVTGHNDEEFHENAVFLLGLLNDYANREITEKDLEGLNA